MSPYSTVYRFRFLPETGAWQKSILYPALVATTAKSYAMSDELAKDCHLIIRIGSKEEQDVVPGDVISFGDASSPPTDGCVTVLSVTDNRRARKCVSHTKLICA